MSRETRIDKTTDGNDSHELSDGHGNPMFKHTFFGKCSFNDLPKFNKYRLSIP